MEVNEYESIIEKKNLQITKLKKENKNYLIRIHSLERE